MDPLREALEQVRDICKPMGVSASGEPYWWLAGGGGGNRERIWRICAAALAATDGEGE